MNKIMTVKFEKDIGISDEEVRLIDKDKLIKKIKAEIDAWAKSRMCMTEMLMLQ